MRLFTKSVVVIALLLAYEINGHAQSVSLVSVDQLETRLSVGKDTTYVLNFWATWCAPCLKEIPHFEKLGAEFGDSKLKVLLISVDYPSKFKSAVIPFAKKLKLKSEVFVINEKDQRKYVKRIDEGWSGALPASIFVNTQKGIRKFFEKEFSYSELVKMYQSI